MAHRLYLEIRTEAEVVAIAREQERFPAFSDVLREYCSADASE